MKSTGLVAKYQIVSAVIFVQCLTTPDSGRWHRVGPSGNQSTKNKAINPIGLPPRILSRDSFINVVRPFMLFS
jgi:hypothetical protein